MRLLQAITFEAISLWTVLLLVLISFAIYIGFFVVNEFVIKLIKNRRTRNSAKRIFPIFTSATWVIYVIYVVYLLVEPHPIVGLAILLVLIMAFWRFLRDFITGLVIRVQDNHREGQRIEINGVVGQVAEIKTTHVDVSSDDGERISIPHSEFFSQVVTKPSLQVSLSKFEIEFKGSLDQMDQLQIAIVNCPWIVSSEAPKLTFTEGSGKFKLVAHTLDSKYIPKIQRFLTSD